MRRIYTLLISLLACLLVFVSCGRDIATFTAPPCQFNYLTQSPAAYGRVDATRLTGLTLTLPASYAEADADTRRYALEEVLTAHLVAVSEIECLVPEDVAYQHAALRNYVASMWAYESAVMAEYGDTADISPDLESYMMRVFEVASHEAAEEALTHAAETLAQQNLALALAFHALGLTVTEETQAEVTASVTEAQGALPADSAYLANEALYRVLMDHLLDPVRCTVVYEDGEVVE